MADRNQRPPAPPKPKGLSVWREGVDYAWDEDYGAWVSQRADGEIIVWMPDEGIFIREEVFLAEQGEGSSPVSQAGSSTGQRASWMPNWWKDEWGPFPMKGILGDEPDYVAAIAIAKWLGEDVDQGAALQEAIAAVEAEIASNQANIGPDANDLALENRLSDLKAQYAQYQQSIQPKETGFQGFSEAEADARVAQLGEGYQKYYNPNTDKWYVDKAEEKLKRSLDQMIEDLIISENPADLDKAFALDAIRDQMAMPRGLTPAQAADLVMQYAGAPDEAREWIDALTSDWNAVRSAEERVTSPGKALLPTAEERNAMPSQAPIEMGTGIPAGVGGTGAGGLAFPAWLTTPGGMPPPQPAFTTTGQAGQFGAPYSPFMEQTIRNREDAMKSASAMIEASEKGQVVFNPETGQWEMPPQQVAFTSPGYTPPGGGYQGPATGQGKGVTIPPGYGPTEQALKNWTQAGWQQRPDGSMYNPQTHELIPAEAVQTQNQKFGIPDINRTPPANAQLFFPGEGLAALEEEEATRAAPQFSTRTATPTTAGVGQVTSDSPQFQASQTAAWKRGDQAIFERNLFDLPTPLSEQDALQQAWMRKWGQKRQAAFEAKPVRRTVFV